jgi:hypothetical protein
MYIEESIWGYVIMMVMILGLDFYTKIRRSSNDNKRTTR